MPGKKKMAEFWCVSIHLEDGLYYFCVLSEQSRKFNFLNLHCGIIS